MNKKLDKKIAIVAGALDLPFLVRDALRARGWDVFVIGLKNFYNPKLNPDMVIRLGGGGAAVRAARRMGIKNVTFVGAIGHPNLSDLRPDLWTLFALIKILKNQRGYDSMAVAFNKALEKFVKAAEYNADTLLEMLAPAKPKAKAKKAKPAASKTAAKTEKTAKAKASKAGTKATAKKSAAKKPAAKKPAAKKTK